MRNDGSTGCGCLLCVALLAFCLLVSALFYDAVMAADWPDWVKWLLLH